MGQLLHGRATTTQATRRAIQHSQESVPTLAKRYNLSPDTVRKWKNRDFVHDAPMGPKEKRSSVLSREEEAAIVLFRQKTLLSLDDCLYSLQESIPHLSRSSLHRCFQRHGISRLTDLKDTTPKEKRQTFKAYPIGYLHIDIADVRTETGKLYLFVAIDRTTKFVHAVLRQDKKKATAVAFLESVLARLPYQVHQILTDNGVQFTNRKEDVYVGKHPFDVVCDAHGVRHSLTKMGHPWTNGQVERMNRTIKEATVKHYHYTNGEQLEQHLAAFLDAYNFAKRLKTLHGLTPYEAVIGWWEKEPERFHTHPNNLTTGLYT